jgi:DNA mismatch repair protein MutL
MSRIRLLPPALANQIAAGEVVERPASVVKELVENALDAGARRISVTTELGGKKLVRVEDDGEGMTGEDARLAIERHATSKIATAEDLGAIRTLGFRGEALPSIASVSHFVLRTRRGDAIAGVEVRVEGGGTPEVREIAAPTGTTIEVADLFFNLPARRKFLKSDAGESAQISRIVTQFALGYPEVGFTLTSGGRRVLQCPPAAGLRERFFQVFGERADLVEIAKDAAGIRITGFVAALAEQGPVRGPQNIFVNRRIVRDRTIAHAIIDAYSTATIKERSPEVHLFFEMAADRLDVNVHPTKAEVRFLEPSLVHEVLRRALADTLGRPEVPELQLRAGAFGAANPAMAPEPPYGRDPLPRPIPGVFGETLPTTASPMRDWPAPWDHLAPGGAAGAVDGAGAATAGAWLARGERNADAGLDRQTGIDAVMPMVPLGQFRDTYIIAIDSEGVLMIDQHVAHERILFEQILERLTAGTLESQRLLDPMVLDLSAGQRQALALHGAELARLGFEVEEFGGATVRVTAVPALVPIDRAATAVRALADDLEGLEQGASVQEALRRTAATMACHAAVKAHDPLTLEKMRYILQELRRTAYSTVCPHGRPVVLRISRREIEKNFQRI